MTSANDDPKQPADTQDTADRGDQPSDRKLTVIGHHTTTPTPPPQTESGEVIRDLVVPRPPNDTSKSDNLRSPKIQDRDVAMPTPLPKEMEKSEAVREMIIPHAQAESENEDAHS